MATNKAGAAAPSKTDLTTTDVVSTLTRPDFIPQGDRSGTEHITKDDMILPRLALAQKSSPQITEGDPLYVEGLKFGELFNSLTGERYGNGPLSFIVLRGDRPRGMELRPLDEGGGVLDFNVPLTDPRMQWGKDGEKPVATMFYDFILMLLPSREVIALSLKSTGIKVAKRLNGLIALRNCPLYAGVYAVNTAKATNKFGTYATYQVANAGFIADKETYDLATAQFETWKNKAVKIDLDLGGHDEGDPDAEGADREM